MHILIRVQLVDQLLHPIGVFLVEFEGHSVGVQGLLLVAQLLVDLAHRHEDGGLLRAQGLQLLTHFKTFLITVKSHQYRHFLVLSHGPLGVEAFGLLEAMQS